MKSSNNNLKVIKLFPLITIIAIITALAVPTYLFYQTNKLYVTNPIKDDGFGSQFLSVIYAVIYADMQGKQFLYSPFFRIETNKDPVFLQQKETLVNMQPYYNSAKYYPYVQPLDTNKLIDVIESDPAAIPGNTGLQNLKNAFRANKPKNFFNNDKINIAIHMRRPNWNDLRNSGSFVNEDVFLTMVSNLREKYRDQNYVIHIYSQGAVENFKKFNGNDIVLHIDTPLEESFTGMALSDVLILSPSAFSYAAGMLSNAEVYYIPFWHKPLPQWHILDINKTETGDIII